MYPIRSLPPLILAAAFLVSPAFGRESVCLRSGFCMQAESHTVAEGMLVVQSGHGTLQFPADQVTSILALQPIPEVEALPLAAKSLSAGNIEAGSEELLIRAALQAGLQPDFVRSVALVESGLKQNALSPKGAVGLMQLMPQTAGKLGVDAKIPDQNARGGAAFLRELLLRYKGDSILALAAYNAGPGAVDKYKGVPPYLETHRYVIRVLREYRRQQQLQSEKNLLSLKR